MVLFYNIYNAFKYLIFSLSGLTSLSRYLARFLAIGRVDPVL
jgi:hypothetical protein